MYQQNYHSTGNRLVRLNLGCGTMVHPAWINIDLCPRVPGVLSHDLSAGIPFPDAAVDVIYHSHMLEHLELQTGLVFLRECWRVLRPGCLIRVVVPDLEDSARKYCATVTEAAAGDRDAQVWHDWFVLELLDQVGRNRSGGGVYEFLRSLSPDERKPLLIRVGRDIADTVESLDSQDQCQVTSRSRPSRVRSRIRSFISRLSQSGRLRERLVQHLLGNEYELLQLGRFRRCGEVHSYMYDVYSLKEAMETAGFVNVRRLGYEESDIPDWSLFRLDSESDGTQRKPGSLYMEGRK